MLSPSKGHLGRSRSLIWRIFASICLFLILLVEWKRFNSPSASFQPQLRPSEFYSEAEESFGRFYGGAGARQLLKKLSNAASAASTTTTAVPTDMQNDILWPENEDFGQAGNVINPNH